VIRSDDNTGYTDPEDGKFYPSVTNILQVLNKPGLVGWAARVAIEHGDVDAPKWVRDQSTARGTWLHKFFDAALHGRYLMPEHDDPDALAIWEWVRHWDVAPVWTEQIVVNRDDGYAGRLDAVLTLGQTRWLLDLKTGNRVHPDVALQLAAYRYATLPDGDPLRVDRTGVLHVRDGRAKLVEVYATPQVYGVFKHLIPVHKWTQIRDAVIRHE
jgi:hypothetical protein